MVVSTRLKKICARAVLVLLHTCVQFEEGRKGIFCATPASWAITLKWVDPFRSLLSHTSTGVNAFPTARLAIPFAGQSNRKPCDNGGMEVGLQSLSVSHSGRFRVCCLQTITLSRTNACVIASRDTVICPASRHVRAESSECSSSSLQPGSSRKLHSSLSK